MKEINILIVEDEPLIAADIDELCQSAGYLVCEVAHNAGQALIAIKEKQPTLILLDINISDDVDGIEIAELLESDFKIPYIFITSYSDPHTLTRVKSLSPSGYIVKPFNKQQFFAVLELAVNRLTEGNEYKLQQSATDVLTEREQEVLQLMLAGKNLGDIGNSLCLSRNTIKHHQKNIYLKLEVHSRAELFHVVMK